MNHPSGYFCYWGKTRRKSDLEGAAYHLLPWHSLDVAACGWQMVMSNHFHAAEIFAELGFARDEAARWFAWVLGAHDLGKFSRGFQQQCSEIHPLLVPPVSGKSYHGDHDSLGYWLWKDYLEPRWKEDVCHAVPPCEQKRLFGYALESWFSIATGHHGKPPKTENEVKGSLAFTAEDKIAAETWLADLSQLLGIVALPECFADKAWREKLKQQSWLLAGLTVLADWMGSNQAYFPLVSDVLPLPDYWQQAQSQAQQVLQQLHVPSAIEPFDSHLALFPFIEHLTPLQQKALEIDISAPGPQLLVLEDVTGAGKTEAALILAHRLMSAGKGDSLYVGLPTMATSNAMFRRLSLAYRALFTQNSTPSLVLAHGARHMSDAFNHSLWSGENHGQHQYAADESAASSACNAWFADSRKKSLLAEVGVGTLDQALMAAMPFKHQSLRLLGLFGKLLILDEVHAYDSYMVRLLEGLLTFHAAQGGSVIILSATLPYSLRNKLLRAFQKGTGGKLPAPDPDAQYPWFSLLTTESLHESFTPTRPDVAREVGVAWLTQAEQAVELIEQAVNDGQCICWIRNTVDEAVEVYRQLNERGNIPAENLLLFHSRFAFVDRMSIETQALDQFGKESTAATRRGKVLIATQVIEQSLDIDLDTMISDLAPIDLLIQRAGRLQRHQRGPRIPPVLHIFAPEWQADPQPDWLKESIPGTSFVYGDHACLWRTQHILRVKGGIRMPEDARELVETVYTGLIAAPTGLQRASNDTYGKNLSASGAAAQTLLRRDNGYERAASDYPWDDVELTTRLSEDTTDLYLAWQDGEPYAEGEAYAWEQSRVSVRDSLWRKMAANIPHLEGDALEQLRLKIRNPGAQVALLERGKVSEFYSNESGLLNDADK
ncbi:CRISPR-associated helicase Cas3' [Buttiauxella selenatireducens]|uniref:CRISPR-associated helicase Cas3 n=1 Tax=Buttiauxella selenatireducens TaxID=3073902 RepID=A0ABY9SDG2_9ENTR|nr:CRISPR-associated helicase Cas3' [Buttiauxella sp. R73]WMY75230.1 CRISPR-associated helicase Cas3' [Buttiauxella sp. R73]